MKYLIVKNIDEMIINEAKTKAYNAGFIGGIGLSLGIAIAIYGIKKMREADKEFKQLNEE